MNEADILAGRAKSVSARHYALYELVRLGDAYRPSGVVDHQCEDKILPI
jgi:hypothetical protein